MTAEIVRELVDGEWVTTVGAAAGGSQTVLTQTTDLTSAQIKTLHTLPVTIIDATGPGTMVVRAVPTFMFKFGTTPYDISGAAFINWGAAAGALAGYFSVTSPLDAAEDQFIIDDGIASFSDTPPLLDTAGSTDVAWQIDCGANPTLGDGTLRVFVEYVVVEVP